MKIKPIFLAALMLSFAQADSLLESYEQAVQHDKQLQAAFYDTKIAAARHRQTVANLLPSFSFNASLVVDKYRRYDRSINEGYKSYGVSMRQQLFRPALWMAAKSEQKRSQLSEYAYAAARGDLALRLSSAYFNYLFAKEATELAKSYHDANTTRLDQVRKSLAQGLANKMDFLEAKIRADKSFVDLSKASEEEQSALLALVNITGKEPTSMPKISDMDLGFFEHLDLEKYSNIALNLDYKQQLIALEIADDEIASKKSEFFPTVDFSASFMDNRYDDERYFGDKRNQFNARLNLSMPLFTSGFLSARLEEAKYAKLKALSKKEQTADEITLKQQKALNEFKVALAQTKIAKKSLEHARLYEQAMERSHELGLKDLVELSDARARAYEARAQAIKSASQLINSYLSLETLVGGVNEGIMQDLSALIK